MEIMAMTTSSSIRVKGERTTHLLRLNITSACDSFIFPYTVPPRTGKSTAESVTAATHTAALNSPSCVSGTILAMPEGLDRSGDLACRHSTAHSCSTVRESHTVHPSSDRIFIVILLVFDLVHKFADPLQGFPDPFHAGGVGTADIPASARAEGIAGDHRNTLAFQQFHRKIL